MPDSVKSAVRVLHVFEYFDRIEREGTVMEIARALDIPQSSTSVLLKSLVGLGYLVQDRERKTFIPTARLTRLGAWVAPALTPDSAVIALMEELGHTTGETIILGALAGEVVRYIHVVSATTALRLHVGPDTARPVATSGMGRMLMSTLPAERVREIVQRHNASERNPERRLNLATVTRDLSGIRAAGYALSLNRITRGAGVIAVLLPSDDGAALCLGIGGLSKTIQEQSGALVKLMRQGIARHLAPLRPLRARAGG